MTETPKVQSIPVKMYRSADRLMVAAPMPGVEPDDILVDVTENRHLLLQAGLRGALKDVKELLIDEWSAGDYYRELELPDAVDGLHANVTYGNGVLVVVLPLSQEHTPAILTLKTTGKDYGATVGNSGHKQAE